MSIAIKVENLSKAYQLGQIGTGTISRDLERWYARVRGKEDPFLRIGESNDQHSKSESNVVWSLKDINFEIEQGDAVGIIGRNGAGKSTLLKILSKVTAPTTGKISGKGRIASLLEVGTGFHPELSGRENIFLNGAILGMRKKEIQRKLEEIVDFAGIERYLDTPVKRYSSGMYVRLAFAVAAHLESEILIVDEVLAVGDAEFQKKCLGKMNDVSKGEGRTVLFVSHNMASIKSLCKKAILLQDGKIKNEGKANMVISSYFHTVKVNIEHFENSDFKLEKLKICDASEAEIKNIINGKKIIIKVSLKVKTPKPNIGFCIAIYNVLQELVTCINTYHINQKINSLDIGIYEFDTIIPPYIFNDGQYHINLHLNSQNGDLYKIFENYASFYILDDEKRRGGVFRGGWPGQISLLPEIKIKEIKL
ncbi:polysaccharide ABC transporter ATP-binding protein [Pedobacter rhodius]|uniref:ABC transporter ATP-binding protein n=1 Tax=Pedobacter rhodius TaxID=3004098 RepID=A0ABT4KSA7_9SPHI|nr:ABC transporter ATP-binding protein [Pedobacter sp. SJ11]MCZ4221811.1 ABC transporter ATP-binding protein [Pedobacter sp. SJ11]